ncbi:hypothetical protein FRC03_010029 [Tulasnella sp. 419]|nr:hypothetical protein FRC03_010029 [Tulasnella sp. 419]
MAAPPTSMMSAPATNLAPPKTDKISLQELARHDGTNGDTIYVAIKGTVFDVSGKRDMYGPGGSYHIFAGKDGSKGLGLSSLKAEDAIPDYSTLGPDEQKVLDNWYDFFAKRYNQVGTVSS